MSRNTLFAGIFVFCVHLFHNRGATKIKWLAFKFLYASEFVKGGKVVLNNDRKNKCLFSLNKIKNFTFYIGI